MRLAVIACVALVTLAAHPATAEPITASVEGCVTSLPDGKATWTSSEHFQFVAFWDHQAGCETTIAIPIVVHVWFENFDGLGGLKTETLLEQFPTCGRIQLDAHSYLDGPNGILDPLGLVSLVYDTGVDCEPLPGPRMPRIKRRRPTVPEPTAALLLVTAVVLRRWPRRDRTRPATE